MGKIAGMFAGFFAGAGMALTVIVILLTITKAAFGGSETATVRISPRVIPNLPADTSVYSVHIYGLSDESCSHCEFREEMEQHDNFWEHLRATEGNQPWIDKLEQDLNQ